VNKLELINKLVELNVKRVIIVFRDLSIGKLLMGIPSLNEDFGLMGFGLYLKNNRVYTCLWINDGEDYHIIEEYDDLDVDLYLHHEVVNSLNIGVDRLGGWLSYGGNS